MGEIDVQLPRVHAPAREGLDRSATRRPDRDHPAPIGPRLAEPIKDPGLHPAVLGVHRVGFELVDLDGLERATPDVERHVRAPDALRCETAQEFGA